MNGFLSRSDERDGAIIAALLSNPSALADSQVVQFDQAQLFSRLLASGSGPFAWYKLRNSSFGSSPYARRLQDAYRLQILHHTINQSHLINLFSVINQSGIDVILGKGWAIAQRYPEPWLRPFGDFDLYVRSEDKSEFESYLGSSGASKIFVDVHALSSSELKDRSVKDIFSRTITHVVDQTRIRIFGLEDHLRLITIHMLKHGAWRPLWLVDIAQAFAGRDRCFDWEYFMAGDSTHTDWVISGIGLAHSLMGLPIQGTPIEVKAKCLPQWLAPTLLREWSVVPTPHGTRVPMKNYLENPKGVWSALLTRWPNGIEASVDLHAPFNNFPRLPLQIADCFYRTYRFIRSLATSV